MTYLVNKKIWWIAMAACLLWMSGCAEDIDQPDAAISIESETINVGQTVTLDGSASSDPQDLPLQFHWQLRDVPAGSQAQLNDRTLVRPSFEADVPGEYTAQLIVANSVLASEPAEVTVTAGECGSAAPQAGTLSSTPSDPGVGLPVQLSATPSDADNQGDCDLQQSLSYDWTLVQLPPGSSAMLNQRDALNPSFTPDVVGDYVFEFVVTDSTGRSSETTQLTVTTSDCGGARPETGTLKANPAAPNTGQVVTVRAAATDADNTPGCERGQTLTHNWSITQRPTGSTARLDSPTLVSPTFVPDVAGDYEVRLVVTDSTGRQSEASELIITASPCGTNNPTITDVQANPSAPNTGQVVVLTATASDADNDGTCALGQDFSWEWRLLATPAGSSARVNGRTLASPTLVPDVAGDYIIEVVATDSTGRQSQPAQITVTAGTCGSRRPSASLEETFPEAAGPGTDVTGPDIPVGQDVQVSGITSSDPDNTASCSAGQDLQYRWSFASLPLDSNATFNNNSVVNPTFTADENGTYVLELRVTDSTGLVSQSARFTITATPLFGINTAAGFTADTVTTGRQLDRPTGIVGDASGNLYVTERAGDSILQILPSGAVSTFASGGDLNTPEDITFDPSTGDFFVINEASEIIRLDATGQQSFCGDFTGRELRQIFYYQGTAGDRLVTASGNDDRVLFIDPSDCSLQTRNDFDGRLDQPFGVAAAVINGQDQVFVSNDTDSVFRNTDGAYSFDAGTTTRLSDQRDEPRGLALTPCADPDVIVADQAAERIVAVDNCAGGNCTETVLVSGLDGPVDLFFESSTSLVVTDPDSRTIFRLTGNFCSL